MIDRALNLLPPTLQAQRRAEARFSAINRLLRIPTIGIVLTIILTQSALFLMQQHYQSLRKDEMRAREEAAATPSADVTKLTQRVNNQISVLRKSLGTTRNFHNPVVTLLNSFPAGITITKITIEPAGTVRIEGVADTRSSFLLLQDVMKSSSVVKNATTTSTASKREQLPFIYTGKLAVPTT